MNKLFQKYIRSRAAACRSALCLLCCLFVFFLSACSRTGMTPEPTPEPHHTNPEETQTPAVSQAQTAFDDWCSRFLRDQLSDSFLNLHYSFIDPEAYGITDYTVGFGDFSLEAMRQARAAQQEFQKELREIPSQSLDNDRKLTYRIMEEALRLEESGDGLELYYQPLLPSNGVQAQLPILLAEFAFRSQKDIDDYLTLLSTIDTYYAQILKFEQEKSSAGLFMTDACTDQIVTECSAYMLPADQNFMTATFDQRIEAFDGLSDEERDAYKTKNLAAVEQHFIPAYELLTSGLTALKGTCTNNQGLYYYPEGQRYYEYLVTSSIGTTYESIETLRDAVSQQIDSDLAAMTDIIHAHPEVVDQIDNYAFSYTEPEQILTHLKEQTAEDFPETAECSYVTKYVPDELSDTLGPAFFLVPPIDDYSNCTIYINPDSTSAAQALYSTLAHEGIPGHMYQNTYFLSHCGSDLRKIISFTSYSEGWASYVENYSYTTDNGLSPALGELLARNASANLGLHALIDININYFGWTREQIQELLAPYFDVSEDGLVDTIYNAMLNAPVNYLEYYVGYLEIIQMRDQAKEQLGDGFSLKDFHQFLLDTGPAPFTVIRDEFQVWLLTQSMQ